MKSLFFVSILILNILTAYSATEPVIKIYDKYGSSKQYKINDIADLSFFRTNLSYSMSVFQSTGNSKSDFDIRTIDSIEFENNQTMKIVQSGNLKSFNITEIDSIIFAFNTCTEIQIGDQVWMCKNLDVDHYRNGDSIPEVRDSAKWANMKTGAWCYYNNDPKMGEIYGKLYNWYAVNDPRGLAPDGWHIPSDAEWKVLEMNLGMSLSNAYSDGYRGKDLGNMLKETGTAHWDSTNIEASNSTGFTALPGGWGPYYSKFYDIGSEGVWFTNATDIDTNQIILRGLSTDYSTIQRSLVFYNENIGYSVRCLKNINQPLQISSIYPPTSYEGSVLTIIGTNFGFTRDTSQVIFNSVNAVTYISWTDTEIKLRVPEGVASGILSVSVNGKKSNEFPFVLNNIIKGKVKIGDQVWMLNNLDVDHFANGDSIPEVRDPQQWINLKTPAWCYYDNDPKNGEKYGKLYNLYAIIGYRRLAPDGWHVPQDEEWQDLWRSLGGYNEAGGKMKEAGTTNWLSPNAGATNSSGFTALPGGNRSENGTFSLINKAGIWWSNPSSEHDWSNNLRYDYSNVTFEQQKRFYGFSVRCVKDK